MAITALDIKDKQFTTKFRGYNEQEVDEFLDIIIDDYEDLVRDNRELTTRVKELEEKLAYFDEMKESLSQSVILAQETAEKVKASAADESANLINKANFNATRLIEEAKSKASEILRDATDEAKRVAIETEELKRQSRVFHQRLLAAVEGQLSLASAPEWEELLQPTAIYLQNSDVAFKEVVEKVLDEYVKDFQKRNPTLRVFGCYLHQDESTPHLHIDFIHYVTDWKGKGMDTRVSLKQALKSLGFQGGNKHDTELNQWMNHEKKVLAEIAKQHGIEWEQKGTHEEHLDVYNFKKKERKKEVQELEQEKEYLTAENEELTAQIAEFRADIQILKDDKEQAIREKQEAEQRAEDVEKELKSLEDRRNVLRAIMDNASKEIKEYGMIKMFLPEAGTFERAAPYRENKIKPLFIKMKNQIAALAGKVVELNKTIESWKNKYQKSTEKCDDIQKQLDDVRKENGKLSNDNQRLQEISDRYDRVVRILGSETVEDVVQQDIKEQRTLEEKRRMEQMPKGSVLKQLEWATQKSQIENQQRKKNKTKYKGLEI